MQFDDSQPIWLQLTAEFQRRVVAGEWPRGQRIPSVRELAAEVGVNPNTVQKSLAELDRLGLTASERTAGRRVTTSSSVIDRARKELARGLADQYVKGVKGMGLQSNAAVELVKSSWERVQVAAGEEEK